MLPQRWTKNTFVPYSSASPLPERFVRHAYGPDTDQQWVVVVVVLALTFLPLMVIGLENLVGQTGILFPLLIAWGVISMTILSTAVLGAMTTGEERRSPQYEMIYLTSVSDFALGYSFLFATFYRMRVWVVLSVAMIPTIILGMIRIGAWSIERCMEFYEFDRCDPAIAAKLSPISSVMLGTLVSVGIIGLVPLAAITGVGLALRNRNPIYAAGITMVGAAIALGMTIALSTSYLIPPPTRVGLWNGMLILEFLILGVIGILIWSSSRQLVDGQEFLSILLAVLVMTFVFGLTQSPGAVRLSVISLALISILPYLLLLGGARYFWRAARYTND